MRINEIINETLGPHEGKELELMLSGKKPAALLDKFDIAKIKKYIDNERLIIAGKSEAFPGYPIYFVAVPGEEWRGPEMVKAYQGYKENPKSEKWHSRMGKLLGYSDEDIQHFIQNSRLT